MLRKSISILALSSVMFTGVVSSLGGDNVQACENIQIQQQVSETRIKINTKEEALKIIEYKYL